MTPFEANLKAATQGFQKIEDACAKCRSETKRYQIIRDGLRRVNVFLEAAILVQQQNNNANEDNE